MPFTGSSATLQGFIIQQMYAQGLILPTDPPDAQANMQKLAAAIAMACEQWILASGVQSVVATVAPGQAVVGAGGGVPGPMSGATTTPGSIATSSLV